MATAGSRQQVVLPDVKEAPPAAVPGSGAQHQMNRPHNYAESSYFIHQRYEDTALVIFQQQAKERKKAKPGSYTPLSQPSSASPHHPKVTAQHLHLPPPGSVPPGKTATPDHPPSPQATTNSSLGSASPAGTRSPHWDTDSATGASSVANSSAVHVDGFSAARPRADTNTSVTESEQSDLDSPTTHPRDPFDAQRVDHSTGSPVDPQQKAPHPANPSVLRHNNASNGVGVSAGHDDVRRDGDAQEKSGDRDVVAEAGGAVQQAGVGAGDREIEITRL